MNVAILGWLAAALLLPATNFAHAFVPGRRDVGYEPVYRDPRWREAPRRGYWHPAERFNRYEGRWNRPWNRYED